MEAVAGCLSVVGFSLATIALFELGTSFGVSPASRGVVRTGVYRWMGHPIYIGYVTAELGFVILNPINGAILGISAALYALRAVMESRVLRGGEAEGI
jgi:protein-S-isoprenylcysteine O-methyltransferase Ste14